MFAEIHHKYPRWLSGHSRLRFLLFLPEKQSAVLYLPQPSGIPNDGYTKLLDADLREPSYIRKKDGDGLAKVLLCLAQQRKESGESISDPVLWLLRIRWLFRASALPFAYLQSGKELPTACPLPEWPTKTQNSFRAMASWACRHSGTEREDDPLRLQILDEINQQQPGLDAGQTVQDGPPRNRGTGLVGHRSQARFEAMAQGNTDIDFGRWIPIRGGPVDEGTDHEGLSQCWWEIATRTSIIALEAQTGRKLSFDAP